MPAHRIVTLSASPSEPSRTAALAGLAAEVLARAGLETRAITLRGVPLEAMLAYPVTDPTLARINAELDAADGVIIATPIYKAAYSGLLKLYLDQLPQFAFAGKAVLPLATGGSLAHVLALDYALRPVLQSMGARHIIQSHFVLASDIVAGEGGASLVPDASGPFLEAVHHFQASLEHAPQDRLLGHPRPSRSAVAG